MSCIKDSQDEADNGNDREHLQYGCARYTIRLVDELILLIGQYRVSHQEVGNRGWFQRALLRVTGTSVATLRSLCALSTPSSSSARLALKVDNEPKSNRRLSSNCEGLIFASALSIECLTSGISL